MITQIRSENFICFIPDLCRKQLSSLFGRYFYLFNQPDCNKFIEVVLCRPVIQAGGRACTIQWLIINIFVYINKKYKKGESVCINLISI
jgi:hypothetical protein